MGPYHSYYLQQSYCKNVENVNQSADLNILLAVALSTFRIALFSLSLALDIAAWHPFQSTAWQLYFTFCSLIHPTTAVSNPMEVLLYLLASYLYPIEVFSTTVPLSRVFHSYRISSLHYPQAA